MTIKRWMAAGVAGLLGTSVALAQQTKLWSVGQFDEFQKGTTEGVAIRSDGWLEAGPAASVVYSAGASYVWSVAAGANGTMYAGLGGSTAGSAAVTRVEADGKAE